MNCEINIIQRAYIVDLFSYLLVTISLNITCCFSEPGANNCSPEPLKEQKPKLKKKKKSNIKMFSELTFSLTLFGSWASGERLPSQASVKLAHQ